MPGDFERMSREENVVQTHFTALLPESITHIQYIK